MNGFWMQKGGLLISRELHSVPILEGCRSRACGLLTRSTRVTHAMVASFLTH